MSTKKTKSFPPIYRFVIKGDWSRFYKKRKGEEFPLCDPDLIIEFQKKPVAFFTPELRKSNNDSRKICSWDYGIESWEIQKKWGCPCPSREAYPIIQTKREVFVCFDNAFFEGDQSGHPLHERLWEQGFTILKPTQLLKHLKELIKNQKIGKYWDRNRLDPDMWSQRVFTNECKKNLPVKPPFSKPRTPKAIKFFTPRVTFKLV